MRKVFFKTNNKKSLERGITLIALVVTVIVLLILAGISIQMLTGDNGILKRASEAKTKTTLANAKEAIQLELLELMTNANGNVTDYQLEVVLGKYGDIQYDESKNITGVKMSDGQIIALSEVWSGTTTVATDKDRYEGGNYNEELGLCTPKLGSNMVGVYWTDKTTNEDGTYKAVTGLNSDASTALTGLEEVTSDSEKFSWKEWYNYAEGNNSNDTKTSRWANAKSTTDGSYFVWIPRYEYKLEGKNGKTAKEIGGTGTDQAGVITVNFIKTTQTTASSSEYKIHPAFGTNLQLGGWSSNIPGIWVAKYEMSMETSENNSTWSGVAAEYIQSDTQGNVLTTSAGNTSTTSYYRAVSKPSCYSWNYITISNCYLNSKAYSTVSSSHLMKNSEWGAVAYLTHSQYGRNGNEIGMNTYYYSNTGYSKLTGYGANNTSATTTAPSADNLYDGKLGQNASTTGNIYGIYDISGGNWEYTSGYYGTHGNINSYGSSLYTEGSTSSNPSKSTKYVTIYPYQTSGGNSSISDNYSLWSGIYGDAIYETSNGVGSNKSWFNNNTDGDAYEFEPFFLRGGCFWNVTSAGAFAFGDDGGGTSYNARL